MISVSPTRCALALLHFEIFVGRRPGNSNVKWTKSEVLRKTSAHDAKRILYSLRILIRWCQLTTYLVLSSFFRPECNGYWHVRRGCQFLPISCLCVAQINSRSSCFDARSCGKPDLLRINSCSCTDPICWLRCHLRNGIRSSRHQGISPPTISPQRNRLATNH